MILRIMKNILLYEKSRFVADGIKITEEKKKVCWKNNKIKKSEKEYLEEYDDGWLKVDIDGAKVFAGEEECLLTPTEFRLLRQFLMNRKQLLTYNVLLERLWDSGNQFVDKHALAVNINRLRGKIEDEEHKYISNVYGMGYQWIGA